MLCVVVTTSNGMKKKTRQSLFYVAVVVFAVLSYLIVMFALGYKYDFVENKFLKTGSFQIKTNVDAQVYINDKLAGNTSFLLNSFSEARLLPRTYSVRVQRGNYQLWQKLVTIEAGRFADFPKVVLLPESDEFREVMVASVSLSGKLRAEFLSKEKIVIVINSRGQTETINFQNGERIKSTPRPQPADKDAEEKIPAPLLSPDGEKILTFGKHEIWGKWIKDAGYQPYKKSGDEELITRFSQEIRDVQWYFDSAHVLADIGGILKLVEIDDRDGINIMDVKSVTGAFYYDRGENMVYTLEERNLVKTYLK